MSVTVTTIAEKLDLSPATISRSLRQSPRVAPATRARVVEMAMKMGYQPRGNVVEVGDELRPGRQYRVAVVGQSTQFRSSVNTVRLLEGIAREAEASNVLLTLGFGLSLAEASGEAVPACVADSSCELSLILGRHHPDAVAAIRERCPVISVDWSYSGLSCDVVRTDDVAGQAAMTERVLDAGHRQLAWIGEAYPASFTDRRLSGVIQGCLSRGIDPNDVRRLGLDAFDQEGHLRAEPLRQALDAGASCFICVSDRVAFEVHELLDGWGLRVPEQVSVTGFDAMQHGQPLQGGKRLTSVDPRFVQIGRSAVELAVRRLRQSAAHPVLVSPMPRVIDGQTLSRREPAQEPTPPPAPSAEA